MILDHFDKIAKAVVLLRDRKKSRWTTEVKTNVTETERRKEDTLTEPNLGKELNNLEISTRKTETKNELDKMKASRNMVKGLLSIVETRIEDRGGTKTREVIKKNTIHEEFFITNIRCVSVPS